jgi:hypothetical protein
MAALSPETDVFATVVTVDVDSMPDVSSGFGLIGLVAGSSVIAAVVTQSVGWARDKLESNDDADFAAIHLAHALEEYAAKCSEMISESEAYDDDRERGAAHVNVPKLADYPVAADLKTLGKRYRLPALNFRVKVDAYRAQLSALWEFDDDETIRLARVIAADVGLDGLKLANRFRDARGLGDRFELENWTIEGHLTARKAAYDEQERERDKRRAEHAKKDDPSA